MFWRFYSGLPTYYYSISPFLKSKAQTSLQTLKRCGLVEEIGEGDETNDAYTKGRPPNLGICTAMHVYPLGRTT